MTRAPSLLPALAALLLAPACAPRLDLGSDLLWSATHERGDLSEWDGDGDGAAQAYPEGAAVAVSDERAHGGTRAVKLTLSPAGAQQNATLARDQSPPSGAYYSAWYYLPRSLTVGPFWAIFKFRGRTAADTPGSELELYDLDLRSLPTGEMALWLYDHRAAQALPMVVPDPIVPVGRWFHLEAYFKGAADETGRVTYWLDGRLIADVPDKATAPTAWMQWMPCSISDQLSPTPAVLFIDDAAITRTRLGPTGLPP